MPMFGVCLLIHVHSYGFLTGVGLSECKNFPVLKPNLFDQDGETNTTRQSNARLDS
jgi:hypothetical protein